MIRGFLSKMQWGAVHIVALRAQDGGTPSAILESVKIVLLWNSLSPSKNE